ncbi:MAG: UDP-N-acetylmuramoyl-tripeptide--D-alanyl-D-alanine ligase [Deltaproteobacteria bacterium]|nr:MAG: UDP-N-acetylmuramoyl-tripeptide--D-alanyl-D-alanine ligase [Deltaproteobacteria bacterium]
MKFTLAEALRATGGRVYGGGDLDIEFAGLSTDSRGELTGLIFLALAGERFDGHDYVEAAAEAGALAAIVERRSEGLAIPEIVVEDTLKALGALGNMVRWKAGFKVGALTGSYGKTSTKNLAISLLENAGVHALGTKGNLNNLIGVPQTLLSASGDEEYAVIEAGISLPGEMSRLSSIIEPDVALITGVSAAHTEGLGSIDGVATEKVKIAEAATHGGTVVLPADEEELIKRVEALRGDLKVVTFGWEAGADYRGADYVSRGVRGSTFTIAGREVSLPLPGRHNAHNALAAWALVNELGVTAKDRLAPFGEELDAGLRGSVVPGPKGSTLLVDCYNANPRAVVAALENLAELAGDHRKLFLLGEMKELGSLSEKEHRKVGAFAAKCGVEKLFLIGPETRFTAEEAREAGLKADAIMREDSLETLANTLLETLTEGDWLLIKGSRSHKLDILAEMLANDTKRAAR